MFFIYFFIRHTLDISLSLFLVFTFTFFCLLRRTVSLFPLGAALFVCSFASLNPYVCCTYHRK